LEWRFAEKNARKGQNVAKNRFLTLYLQTWCQQVPPNDVEGLALSPELIKSHEHISRAAIHLSPLFTLQKCNKCSGTGNDKFTVM